jgi:hypothetical protein
VQQQAQAPVREPGALQLALAHLLTVGLELEELWRPASGYFCG